MNSHHRVRYNLDDAWPAVELNSARDCLEQLYRLGHLGQTGAYHGAYGDWEYIFSSLDLHFKKKKTPAKERLTVETRLLETFAQEADPHFSPEARWQIERASAQWKTLRNTGTLFVGRHYGLPTRCVDWTDNCLKGLFIACRRDFSKPGVVWWMNNDEFSDRLEKQWRAAYGKNEHIEDDFQRDFIDGREKGVLVRLYHLTWMERPTKQEAWITLADQYGVRHDKAIYRLGVRNCGRLIINPPLKRELLTMLSRLGISGTSLGLGDACVETIAADVVQKLADGKHTIGSRGR